MNESTSTATVTTTIRDRHTGSNGQRHSTNSDPLAAA
jgi:hypothetical protein